MRHTLCALALLLCLIPAVLTGCGQTDQAVSPDPVQTAAAEETEADTQETEVQEEEAVPQEEVSPKLVVIDPGHQDHANTAQEAIGPGATETKMKVTGGTAGVATGIAEYQLTLTVSQQLKTELEARGYQVLLTRETNDVDLSNQERAAIANEAGADVFLRIHANGSEDSSVQGAMTLCPTAENPYPVGALYAQCRTLAETVLEGLTAATGAQAQSIWETDTMSGINWCQVPVTIVEMGYMSNPDEDRNLNDPDYQAKLVIGIANGVDQYFARETT
jgi:N-acetylmuramoyl-L-alanine amidase